MTRHLLDWPDMYVLCRLSSVRFPVQFLLIRMSYSHAAVGQSTDHRPMGYLLR